MKKGAEIPTLKGLCIRHPQRGYEVIEANNKYYYLDSDNVDNWEEGKYVYFTPEKSHAFDLEIIK